MKKIVLFSLLFFLGISAFATHNRAGEITYQHISGYTYLITVTTYTKESSIAADKCSLTILFGDSDSSIANRVNGPKGNLCGGIIPMGETLGNDIKKNVYQATHTYPGPKTYVITMEDPNRNGGICNLGGNNSDSQSFFLRSVLQINSFLPPNSSPVLLNPPIDNGCIGECFEHNPGAFDKEGDSLSYSLVKCYGNGQLISNYTFPENMTASSINPVTGDIVWCAPPVSCQYNIAILIEEWRLLAGKRYFVGSVLRDMQIDIGPCQNHPPKISHIADTCIEAGTTLNFTVTAEDIDKNKLTLTAKGGPFLLNPKATFTTKDSIQKVSGKFSWTPNCSEIQLLPYNVTFKVTDNHPTQALVNFESIFIRVVAPAVTGLIVTPTATNMVLKWNEPFCHDTSGIHRLEGYDIYRKNTCDTWVHQPCETGIPVSAGYTLIGSTDYLTRTFIDNNSGFGLIHGIDYSYIVVARYIDASQSYASKSVCKHLTRDVPIITNVSVVQTDPAQGKIWIHWVKPLGITPNLDTIVNPPPYEYKLLQSSGFQGAIFSEIKRYSYASYSQLTDTGFVSTDLNTRDSAYAYRVDFYANGLLIGSTHPASSVFLKTTPSDNAITLAWQENVPWTNYLYYIYRETSSGSGIFSRIDSTTRSTYTDTMLLNEKVYCYKIRSLGEYADSTLPKLLNNISEIKCDTPKDLTPPCQPPFAIAADCELEENILSWINPNTICSDDAVGYHIYFSPTPEQPLALITTIMDVNQTSYTHQYYYGTLRSIAGCYAITAIDSSGNESKIVTISCVDNCPRYELPNVFTPNGDNQNDLFTPLPHYRYVTDVNMKIFDRWGLLMFETKDPQIRWNGTNVKTKQPCPSGTYYYICEVHELRLTGITVRALKGFIELIKEEGKSNK